MPNPYYFQCSASNNQPTVASFGELFQFVINPKDNAQALVFVRCTPAEFTNSGQTELTEEQTKNTLQSWLSA